MIDILVISLVVAAVVSLAMWRLDWALGLVVLLLPFYTVRFALGGLPFTLLEISLVALAVVFFWQRRLYRLSFLKQSLDRVPFKIPIVIFLAAASLGVIVSPDLYAALGEWRAYFIEAIIFFFIFVNVVQREREQKTILWALGLAALVVSLYAIIQNYTGINIPEPWSGAAVRRVTAWYGYPVAVALFLTPLSALFTSLSLIRKSPLPKIFCLGVAAASLTAVYFTHSRGAIIAWLIALLGLSLVPGRWTGLIGRFGRWWRIAVLIAVLACVLVLFLMPGISDRFVGVFTGQDNSTNVRLVMWQGTWRLIQEHWLWGAGLAGFPILYDQYREARHTELLLYPHNLVLNFWVEIGLAGLIAFFWLVVNFFRKARAAVKISHQTAPVVLGAGAAMIVLLVQGLIDVPYFKNDLSFLFWIIVGLITTSYEINRSLLNKGVVR